MVGMRSRRMRYYYASTLPQLEAYAISKLPNLPGAYAIDVAIAAQAAAVNQAFSAEAVIDTLALSGLYYWDGRNGAGVAIGSSVSSLPSWGSTKTLSQASGNSRPTQTANAVRFDGVDDFLENLSGHSGAYSLIMAGAPLVQPASDNTALFSSAATGGVTGSFQVDYVNPNINFTISVSVTYSLGAFSASNSLNAITYSSGSLNAWRNGTQSLTNQSIGTSQIDAWRFGINRGNNRYINWDLYAAIGYAGLLSATQRTHLERYLNARFSLGILD
jgi:hypothetical protein